MTFKPRRCGVHDRGTSPACLVRNASRSTVTPIVLRAQRGAPAPRPLPDNSGLFQKDKITCKVDNASNGSLDAFEWHEDIYSTYNTMHTQLHASPP